jgi:hypothetical protein
MPEARFKIERWLNRLTWIDFPRMEIKNPRALVNLIDAIN